jgi:phosphatidylglycerol:prolipoprotein diacylglycerol transferase
VSRVAFNVGGLAIHWYGILVAAGFVAGLWTASRRAPRADLAPVTIADYGPWAVLGAIVGARLWFVLGYWEEEFASRPLWHVFNLRAGGLVFYGGLVGATLVTVLFARWRRVALWNLADVLAPSIALGHAFGRVGCLFNGCCHGTPTDLPWAVHYPDDPVTRGAGVHPTPAYEALLLLGLYATLAAQFRRRQFHGQTFALYLLAYAVLRFGVEFLRGDYGGQNVAGLKPGQAFSVVVLAAGAALYATLRKHRLPPPAPAA